MIDKKWIVSLKGKDYPLWAGILDAATEAGLSSLKTTIVQLPSPENGHYAAVVARAEFKDGRVFEDVGDCSPQSTSAMLAGAALRLASTRAKGRCLRDAINVGQTMFEELPSEEMGEPNGHSAHRGASPSSTAPPAEHRAHRATPRAQPAPEAVCGLPGCGVVLSADEILACRRHFPNQETWCRVHGKARLKELREQDAQAEADSHKDHEEEEEA